jgi:hypothetical protein
LVKDDEKSRQVYRQTEYRETIAMTNHHAFWERRGDFDNCQGRVCTLHLDINEENGFLT